MTLLCSLGVSDARSSLALKCGPELSKRDLCLHWRNRGSLHDRRNFIGSLAESAGALWADKGAQAQPYRLGAWGLMDNDFIS